MLSDRSYMRDDYPRQATSALTWLISATVAVYVLAIVVSRMFNGGDLIQFLLGVSGENIRYGRIWTLISYGFTNDYNPLSIFLQMLSLYFIGRVLEPMLGSRRFVWLYLALIAAGGALFLGVHWRAGLDYGSSAAIAGLFTVFACFYPNQPISFLVLFLFPVTVKPKWVALGWLGVALLGFAFFEVGGVAQPLGLSMTYSTHLGAMLAAWIYYRYIHEASWPFASSRADIELPRWLRKGTKAAVPPPVYHVDLSRPHELRAEVDRILDKINSQGFGALSAEEKRLLDEARELLSRR